MCKTFGLPLDADDAIIHYLFSHQMLIKSEDLEKQDSKNLKAKSQAMLVFLNKNSAEINKIIQEKAGYIGSQTKKD